MKKRKIIALATSFIMAFTIMVPLTSFAEEGTDQADPQAVQEETPDADVTSGVDEETQPAAEADTAQKAPASTRSDDQVLEDYQANIIPDEVEVTYDSDNDGIAVKVIAYLSTVYEDYEYDLYWKELVLFRSDSEDGIYERVDYATLTDGVDIYEDQYLWDYTAKAGQTYYYKVQAFGSKDTSSGELNFMSKESDVCTVTASFTIPTPTIKAFFSGSDKIKISWQYVDNSETYDIYRATKKSGTYKKIGTVTDCYTTSYIDRNLVKHKKYWYKVQAVTTIDGATVKSNFSTVKKAAANLSKPTLKAKVAGTTSVKVSWSKDNEATGYMIYRAQKKHGKYKLVKTIKRKSTVSYTDKKLKTKKRYYYKVRSYKVANGDKYYSSYSAIKSAKPTPNVAYAGKEEDYSSYGGVRVEKMKVTYKGSKLQIKVKFYNNRMFRADYFDYVEWEIYDEEYDYLGHQTFHNKKLGIKPYGKKWITFTFSKKGTKQRGRNLRGMDVDYEYDYYYHYSY